MSKKHTETLPGPGSQYEKDLTRIQRHNYVAEVRIVIESLAAKRLALISNETIEKLRAALLGKDMNGANRCQSAIEIIDRWPVTIPEQNSKPQSGIYLTRHQVKALGYKLFGKPTESPGKNYEKYLAQALAKVVVVRGRP